MTDSELTFRPVSPTEDDLSFVKRSMDANQETKRSEARFRWQYRENPVSDLYIDVAVDPAAEVVAAMYAAFPVHIQVNREVVIGAQSLDTLTDVRYRGRGLFIKLARSLYGRLREQGVALVYGFPNGSSAHGFFNKLNWQCLDPVPFLIRPLRTRYFVARLPRIGKLFSKLPDIRLPSARSPRVGRNQRIETVTQFDEQFDLLWEVVAPQLTVAVVRDRRYLAWRFGRRPQGNYVTLALRENDHLLGFVTYCVRDKHAGRIGYIMELLVAPGANDHADALLATAVHGIRQSGADAVLAWCLPHSASMRVFRRLHFVQMLERLRPIELHFGAVALRADLMPVIANRANWYISYADSDTV